MPRLRSRSVSPFTAALSVALIGAWLVALPSPASAATHTFSNGTLTLNGTNGYDPITVNCGGSQNVQNLFVDLVSPTVACADVELMVIKAKDGSDSVVTGGMFAGSFPALTEIDIDLGAGFDSLQSAPSLKETIDGGPSNDYLTAHPSGAAVTLKPDRLVSGDPTDTLVSVETVFLQLQNFGPTTLDATAFQGETQVVGTSLADTITTGPGDDVIQGIDDADTISAGGGDDLLIGGTGGDSLQGGSGRDEVRETSVASNVTLTDSSMTGVGTDALSSIEAAEIGQTGATGRTMNFGAFSGFVTWEGGAGIDTVTSAPQGGSSLEPGGANDVLTGGAGVDEIVSEDISGAGTLTNSALVSSNGTDTFTSIEAATLEGTSASQTFNATAFSGATFMQGRGGVDVLNGGPGPSSFDPVDGVVVNGGAGTDALEMESSGVLTVLAGSTTGDVTSTFTSIEVLRIEVEDLVLDTTAFPGRLITTFDSGSDGEEVHSGPGNDVIVTGNGPDEVNSGGGKDRITGNGGPDDLNGGQGTDTCNGGSGADTLKNCEKGKA